MARRLTHQQIRQWLPPRRKDAHKGDMGRIYVVAGSRGMAGAALLTSMGAIRAGAGLVRLGIVKSQQTAAVTRGPLEMTTDGLPEGKDGKLSAAAFSTLEKAIKKFAADVVAIGPGLGQSATVQKGVRRLVRTIRLPVVLDADGLNAFTNAGALLAHHRGPLVITPHVGELGRLLNRTSGWVRRHREAAALLAARRYRCVCLLKGAGTLVTDGRQMWENPTGNPGMASGGMGDVLTGVIAAFRSQMAPLQAACVGAYLHGLAGDWAAKKISKVGFVASDLAGFIPKARAEI